MTSAVAAASWKLLLGPGPCNAPERVRNALARPVLGHLDPDFLRCMDETKALLRQVFRTGNRVTFPVSGTGSAGMEAVLVNLLEQDDVVLVAIAGVFGRRLADLAERLGARVERVEGAWGRAVDPEAVADAARRCRPKLIAVVNGETSTGMFQDLRPFGAIARELDALLVADCVTSLAGMPVQLDRDGVDAAYSGTQKCLACPPGLAPVSFNERALAAFRARRTRVPSFYLDLGEILKYVDDGVAARAYHHTAPTSMVVALREALLLVVEEGLEARWARHADAAAELIRRVAELGLEPLVPAGERLHPLTTLRVPDGIDEAALRRRLLVEHGIEIGGGLGPLAGKVWRIGLMGENAAADRVDRLIEALRACL